MLMLSKSWNCLYFHYVISVFIVSSFLAHGFCQYKRQYIFTQQPCRQPWGSQISDKKFVLNYYLWTQGRGKGSPSKYKHAVLNKGVGGGGGPSKYKHAVLTRVWMILSISKTQINQIWFLLYYQARKIKIKQTA